jgi:hypothetical protein
MEFYDVVTVLEKLVIRSGFDIGLRRNLTNRKATRPATSSTDHFRGSRTSVMPKMPAPAISTARRVISTSSVEENS